MRIEGAIRPTGDATDFKRDAWCRLVSRRPEFRRPSPREIRNPFTGKAATIRPTNDVAVILLDGREVGQAYWSMSDDAVVNVSVEPSALPLVMEWAAELGGKFQAEAGADA